MSTPPLPDCLVALLAPLMREWCERRVTVKCKHIPAESVRDDGIRLCAICHEPLKEPE